MHQETNPHLFLQGFLSSDLYKTAYDAFFSEKTIPLEVTQEEKDTTFLGSQEANTALVDYGQGVVHFRYDPDQFNEDENALIHTYMQKVAVRYYQDPEEIRKYERERTQAHNEIAQEFAKNRGILTKTNRNRPGLWCSALVAPADPEGDCQLEKDTANRIDQNVSQAWSA